MPRAIPLPFNRLAEHHPYLSIEVEVLARGAPPPGLPQELGSIAHDGSLRPNGRYPTAYEARLGPYIPAHFQQNVTRSLAILSHWSNGISVNQSCGLHMHLDMTRIAASGRTRAISRWLLYEPLMLACIPGPRLGNQYCRPLNYYAQNMRFESMQEPLLLTAATRESFECEDYGRYLALNPAAIRRHPTYEIRLGAGTANPRRAIEWAYLTSHILHKFATIPLYPFEYELGAVSYLGEPNLIELANGLKALLDDRQANRLLAEFIQRNSRSSRLIPYTQVNSFHQSLRRRTIQIPRGFNIV